MHIARIGIDNRREYAFRSASNKGWVTATEIGLQLPDFCSLIDARESISDRLATVLPEAVADFANWYAPITRPGKILAVGLNYLTHINEVGKPTPAEPTIFSKYPSSITGPYDRIQWPIELTKELDYECELAVVIGKGGKNIDQRDALNAVFGYCVANDVSARDIQRSQHQISLSKGMDTFCPIGPWITTSDDVPDPQNLEIRTTVNGQERQRSVTADMLFSVTSVISYLSKRTTLEPGDVILTGTPSGVGSGMRPPQYLKTGDTVTCEIKGLGQIQNTVAEFPVRAIQP